MKSGGYDYADSVSRYLDVTAGIKEALENIAKNMTVFTKPKDFAPVADFIYLDFSQVYLYEVLRTFLGKDYETSPFKSFNGGLHIPFVFVNLLIKNYMVGKLMQRKDLKPPFISDKELEAVRISAENSGIHSIMGLHFDKKKPNPDGSVGETFMWHSAPMWQEPSVYAEAEHGFNKGVICLYNIGSGSIIFRDDVLYSILKNFEPEDAWEKLQPITHLESDRCYEKVGFPDGSDNSTNFAKILREDINADNKMLHNVWLESKPDHVFKLTDCAHLGKNPGMKYYRFKDTFNRAAVCFSKPIEAFEQAWSTKTGLYFSFDYATKKKEAHPKYGPSTTIRVEEKSIIRYHRPSLNKTALEMLNKTTKSVIADKYIEQRTCFFPV